MSLYQSVKNIFTKSGYPSSMQGFGRIMGLKYQFFDEVNIDEIINAYVSCSPVYDATNRITESCLDIPYSLKEKDKEVYDYKHPFLKLLQNPNAYQDGEEFFEEMYNSYLIFNNLFIHISGANQPLELLILKPQNVSYQFDIGGYPSEITYNANNETRYYKFTGKGFFDEMGSELIHLKGYNPLNSGSNSGYFGISRLAPLQVEIMQYILLNVHNHALLKNEGRPSGLLTYKGDPSGLSDEMVSRLQVEFEEMFKGAANSGKIPFLTGDFDFKQLSESIKDMDFPQLAKRLRENVYVAYHIPLPFISNDRSTMSNLGESQVMYYRDAVFPIMNRVTKFLMNKILYKRYSGSDKYVLSYDKNTVDVIREQLIKDTDKISKANVLTQNELRTRISYEGVEGGDVVMVPLNMQPLGKDIYTEDQRVKPGRKDYSEEYVKQVLKRYNYSESEIEAYIKCQN